MSSIPQKDNFENNYPSRFRHLEKRVCCNCYHYFAKGLCACREISDMIRTANKCPDWTAKA